MSTDDQARKAQEMVQEAAERGTYAMPNTGISSGGR